MASGDLPTSSSTDLVGPASPPSVPSAAPPTPAEANPVSSDAAGGTENSPGIIQGTKLFDKSRFRVDPDTGRLVRLTAAEVAAEKRRKMLARRGKQISRQPGVRDQELIAGMSAVGASAGQIGKALSLHPQTVRQHLSKPEVQEIVDQHRGAFRTIAAEKALGVVSGAFKQVKKAVQAGDGKSFDQFTRGLAALERIGASVAGENKPGNVQVAVVNQLPAGDEAADLLRAFKATVLAEAGRG